MKPVAHPAVAAPTALGWALAVVGLPLITVAFANLRDTFGLTSVLLLYLVLAMVVALVGGVLPAVVAVIGGFLLANWYFTPPYYQLTIAEGENLLALVVYVFAAGIVAVLVDRVGRSRMPRPRARRPRPRRWPRSPARWPARAPSPRCSASCESRSGCAPSPLLERTGRPGGPSLRCRDPTPPTADHADISRDIGGDIVLALDGGTLTERRPAGAQRLRRPGGCGCRARAAARRGGKAADLAAANKLRGVAAAGRLARPADPAGVDQGVDLQPAPTRHRLVTRRRRRVPADDRGGDRSARPTRRQPARHEPAAGVGAARRARGRPASRRSSSRRSPASAPQGRDVDVDVPETLPDVLADRDAARAGARQPHRQRRPPRPERPAGARRGRRGRRDGEAPRRRARHRPRPRHPARRP